MRRFWRRHSRFLYHNVTGRSGTGRDDISVVPCSRPSHLIIAQSVNTDSADAMLLALKRWVGQGTLTSPDTASAFDSLVRYWLFALCAIALAGIVAQGPKRFFLGLTRWSDFKALLGMGLVRLRSRLVVPMALAGFVLCSWTTSQLLQYDSVANLDALQLSLRGKTIAMFGLEQGVLTALTPLRDLLALADVWPLAAAGLFFGFRYTSQAQWVPRSVKTSEQIRAQTLAQIFWVVVAVWLVYRIVVGVSGEGGLPLHSGAWFEVALEPATMLLIDSVLAAWVVVELRDSLMSDSDSLGPDPVKIFSLFPAMIFVCFLLAPGRYFAHVVWLAWNSFVDQAAQSGAVAPDILSGVIWALSWGIVDIQVIAMPFALLAGAAAFGGGSIGRVLRIAWRTLRGDASLYFATTIAMGTFGLMSTSLLTSLMLSHPSEPWVLMAADFYCHLASLAIGLWYLCCLIELCSRHWPAPIAESDEPVA
jgi:hypothetical protein